jgi:hypothetical protein
MTLDVTDGKTRGRQFGRRRQARYSSADDEGVDDMDVVNDATRDGIRWSARALLASFGSRDHGEELGRDGRGIRIRRQRLPTIFQLMSSTLLGLIK